MALYEKNVDFEPLIVDITKGEQYSSWFLELNPRGEIPVLKVKNELIPDSTRILDYLEFYLDAGLYIYKAINMVKIEHYKIGYLYVYPKM